MPTLRTYNLFISHAWKYNEDYDRLVGLLNSASNFSWKNYSVSIDNPLAGGSKKKLAEEITQQISLASVVLIITGMYVSYREWIKFEIDRADQFNKPIVGIQPWGSTNVPFEVKRSAWKIVGWNTQSVVKAVRQHAL